MKRVKEKQNKGKWFVILILLVVLMIYGALYTEKVIKPNMAAIAEVRVRSMMSQVINDAVNEHFMQDDGTNRLFEIMTDSDGNISFVQSNTVAMNALGTSLTKTIQTELRNIEMKVVEVPLGSILGNQILSQVGPYVDLKVLPIGTSKVNFKSEFESTGINQTKYKVFLELNSQARVLAPFSMNNIQVQNTILLAEVIIVGDVPNSYINVPKEDILDATDNVPE